jgi:lipoprotein LpqB-like beta-propeller protein/sporulation and spore germination protein
MSDGSRDIRRAASGPVARRVRGAVLLVVLSFALAACGVPDSGPAVVVSKAPLVGSDNGTDDTRQDTIPPDPSLATSPDDLVQLFLSAAGADPDRIKANVAPFFTADQRAGWRPDSAGITLVRVTEISSSADKDGAADKASEVNVRVTGEQAGTLTGDGSVQPVPDGRPTGYDQVFHVQKVAGESQWRIANPPAETLLSTDAMSSDYDEALVYFATPDHRHLVPDLRYLPKSMLPAKRRTVLVDWLLDGPSTWLGQAAVNEIPDGTKLRGNVVLEGNTVVVNLTSDADEAGHRALMAAQLAWTLRLRLKILIEGQPMRLPGVSSATYDWQTWKNYDLNTIADDSGGYYVTDGGIVPVRSGEMLPDVLAEAGDSINSRVQSAALSIDSRAAAVVRTGSDGKPQLWIGHDSAERFDMPVFVHTTGLHAGPIGEPSFVATAGTAVVPVDGKLAAVFTDGSVTSVGFAEQTMTGITAAAVAPDGCRIAFVADGRVYVAALSLDSRTHVLTIGRPRPVATGFTSLTDLAWTQEDSIVLGGRGLVADSSLIPNSSHSGAWQFSIDGAVSELLTGSESDMVPEYVGSSPGDPSNGSSHGTVLLSVHDRLLQISGNDVVTPNGETRAPRGTAPFFPS